MKKVIVICGPTATGKTLISLLISNFIKSEIINCDSRQIYKYLDIGTAKPSIQEQQVVPHHFIDIVFPDEPYNAGLFGEEARKKIDDIIVRNKIPIIVGGSGLYLRSLIDGLFEGPKRDEKIRMQIEERLNIEGPESLWNEIMKVDPESAEKLSLTNYPRLVRALEVFYITGEPLSKLQKNQKIEIDLVPSFYGIKWERSKLYKRVNQRTIDMLKAGLVDECRLLLSKGYTRNLQSLQTVGYKECFDFLEGKITESEMIYLIQMNTRHYVKRQFTWFNRDNRIKWITIQNENDFESSARFILSDFYSSS